MSAHPLMEALLYEATVGLSQESANEAWRRWKAAGMPIFEGDAPVFGLEYKYVPWKLYRFDSWEAYMLARVKELEENRFEYKGRDVLVVIQELERRLVDAQTRLNQQYGDWNKAIDAAAGLVEATVSYLANRESPEVQERLALRDKIKGLKKP